MKAHLDAHGISVANVVPIGNTIFPGRSYPEPADPRDRIEALRTRIARLAPLEPGSVVVVSGPMPDIDPARFFETCAWALLELSEAARDEGVALALEPIRPLVARQLPDPDDRGGNRASRERRREGRGHPGGLCGTSDRTRRCAIRSFVTGIGSSGRTSPTIGPERHLIVTARSRARVRVKSAALVAVLDEIGFDGLLDIEHLSDDGRLVERVEPPCLWQLDPDEFVERCARFAG